LSNAVIGTYLNVAGIVAGGATGLTRKKPLSNASQVFFKTLLGVLTIFFGLRLTWISLNGSAGQILKQFGVVLLALSLGKIIGGMVHLQKSSNRLGQFARDKIAAAQPGDTGNFMAGFKVCTGLFCAAPIGILGAIHDGLSGYFAPLAIKAAMDALAGMGFASIFGWGVLFSAVQVLVFQGTISMACSQFLLPWLNAHGLTDSVNATGGILIFSIALVIFEVRKIQVTDYLPSLVIAPLLTWWWLR
jgi:uncharacterized membrane protein YqgA involved in biofilm formation